MSDFPLSRILCWSGVALILIFGIWLRLPGAVHRAHKGTDEAYYEGYVLQLRTNGLSTFPAVCRDYIERQKVAPYAFLPPTRVLFLTCATVWGDLFHIPPLEAIRWVSFMAGVATLGLGLFFAWRVSGWGLALATGTLLAVAPLAIHLSHRALIDGFFAFWALVCLWALWEALQAPQKSVWLWIYGAGLVAMVLTKENAAFAYLGLFAVLGLNRWLKIGAVTLRLWLVTLLVPAIGVLGLLLAAGEPGTLLEAYQLNIQKSVILPYAISTGDGPWHRYLLDFLLVSPAVVALALAALVGLDWKQPATRYFAVFLVISYALMAQVKYGMNLRYGAMWELPLCWLAVQSLVHLGRFWEARWRPLAIAFLTTVVAASEVWQYNLLFVRGSIYDPVAGAMTQPLHMWKPSPANGRQ